MSDDNATNSVVPSSPGNFQNELLTTYSSIREPKTGFTGKRTHYSLYLDSDFLFHTKIKSSTQKESIPISEGQLAHYSKPSKYALLSTNSACSFKLIDRTQNDKEIMTFNIDLTLPRDSVRHMEITFIDDSTDQSVHLVSRDPIHQPDGIWALDFGERYAIPSYRNCIFMIKGTDENVLQFRKTEENLLEVDASDKVPSVVVFASSVCVWISPE